MAVVHGKTLKHTVVTTALEENTRRAVVNMDIDQAEITAANTNPKKYLQGLYSWGVEADMTWNPAAGKNAAVIYGIIASGAQTVAVRPAGGTVGANNPEYTGSAIVKNYHVTIPHDGVIVCKASYEGSGDLDRDVTP